MPTQPVMVNTSRIPAIAFIMFQGPPIRVSPALSVVSVLKVLNTSRSRKTASMILIPRIATGKYAANFVLPSLV